LSRPVEDLGFIRSAAALRYDGIMNKKTTALLRSTLAFAVLLSSPGLPAYCAAAETVNLKVPARIAVMPVIDPALKMPGVNAALPNVLSADINVAVPAGVSIQAVQAQIPGIAVSGALDAKILSPEASLDAAPSAAQRLDAGALATLAETQKPEASAPADAEASGWRWSGLFDLMPRRESLSATAPVTAVASAEKSGVPALEKKTASQPASKQASIPRPVRMAGSRGFARVGTLVLVAALVLALPAVAMAAGPAAAAVSSLSLLSSLHPLATAATATIGALYGLAAARGKDGQTSTGEAMVSMLKYGILAGSGTYLLVGLTQGLFLGFASATLSPLPSAVATGALGASAFQGKFTDPTSTPADRIVNAFPAVAAALGLSVGAIALAATTAPLMTLAAGALTLTGVASAVYAALYKHGKSSAEGPAKMGRGFVLQSLMAGLALTVSNPYFALTFAALAAWGFWDVLSTTVREAWSQLPEAVRGFRRPKN